jgi:hypothetical protein
VCCICAFANNIGKRSLSEETGSKETYRDRERAYRRDICSLECSCGLGLGLMLGLGLGLGVRVRVRC